jgi:hypothetical protein
VTDEDVQARSGIRNLGDLIEAATRNPAGGRRVAWFRGQGDATWRLTPKVWRVEPRQGVDPRKHETILAMNFRRQAPARYGQCPGNLDFPGWLMLMQHHGLPTRLLDWSASVIIAIYFAVEDADLDHANGALWILDPNALNLAQMHNKALLQPGDLHCELACSLAFNESHVAGYEEPVRPIAARFMEAAVAIEPLEAHLRMLVQQSRFTVHGPNCAIDDISGRVDFLRKIIIPCERKAELRSVLELAGTRRSTVFPDLDNLSKELSNYR